VYVSEERTEHYVICTIHRAFCGNIGLFCEDIGLFVCIGGGNSSVLYHTYNSQGFFAEMQGFFAEIQGCFADI